MSSYPDSLLTAQLAAAIRGEPPPGGALAAAMAFGNAAKAILLPGQYSDHARLSLQARLGCEAVQLLSDHLRASAIAERELLRMQELGSEPPNPEGSVN